MRDGDGNNVMFNKYKKMDFCLIIMNKYDLKGLSLNIFTYRFSFLAFPIIKYIRTADCVNRYISYFCCIISDFGVRVRPKIPNIKVGIFIHP